MDNSPLGISTETIDQVQKWKRWIGATIFVAIVVGILILIAKAQ